MSRMISVAGAAMSRPSRASANCCVARRGLTASIRLALLQNLSHLVRHLLDRLLGGDLARHGLAEGGLYGVGGHVGIEGRHRAWLQVLERCLRSLGVGILLLDVGIIEDRLT